jgi:hypothetical protein
MRRLRANPERSARPFSFSFLFFFDPDPYFSKGLLFF